MFFMLSLQDMEGDNKVVNIIANWAALLEQAREKLPWNENLMKKVERNIALQAKIICFFGICVVISLCVVEIACMAFIHTWNDEVFKAITGLVAVIIGFFVFRKTKR
jgi:hypothetical protein